MVTSITVAYDETVTPLTGAFEVVKDRQASIPVAVANPSGDSRTFVLTFSGSTIVGSSLADGVYELTARADRLQDSSGQPFTADHVESFHRLFGDSDGDKDVDDVDAASFSQAQNSLSTMPNYRSYFDYHADNDVDAIDTLNFRQRQGTSSLGAPTDLAATTISHGQIDLSWKDRSSDELAFLIEASMDGIEFEEVATVGAGGNRTELAETNETRLVRSIGLHRRIPFGELRVIT